MADADDDSPSNAPIEPTAEAGTVPFANLQAPEPLPAAPPAPARWLAFASILLGGLLGGLIGYGTGELMGGSSTWAGIGTVAGAATGAIGVGIVASLTLRAMNEWQASQHPEAQHPEAGAPE